jgi:DNA repair protein RadA/Sms
MAKSCKFCGRDMVPGRLNCIVCGQLQVGNSGFGKETIKFGTSTKLSDIPVDETKRLSFAQWDWIFGETLDKEGNTVVSGLAEGSANLLGGEPGAGKSTLSLQIAGLIASKYRHEDEYILYIATEEKPASIAARARRIGIDEKSLNNVRIQDFSSGDLCCYEYIENVQVKPKVVIIDSTEKLARDLNDELSHLGNIAHSKNITMLYIHHVNKQFEFAGGMNIQHLVDGTFALVINNETGTRELGAIKNRNGRTGIQIKFMMNEDGRGLDLVPDLEYIKDNKLPSREDYLRRSDGADLVIETDDEEIEYESSEKAFESLEKFYAMYTSPDTSSKDKEQLLIVIENLLNFANYTWEE